MHQVMLMELALISDNFNFSKRNLTLFNEALCKINLDEMLTCSTADDVMNKFMQKYSNLKIAESSVFIFSKLFD